jgi:hypothetical protein
LAVNDIAKVEIFASLDSFIASYKTVIKLVSVDRISAKYLTILNNVSGRADYLSIM